ncbi:MAG: NAD+ synthase [Candidatus Aminicenantia bacterium]
MRLNPEFIRKFLVKFLRDEIGKFGFNRGIFGLSGGVDSSVVSFLASDALGEKNCLALIMPYKTSDPNSVEDAVKLAEQIGINYKIIEITPMIDAYFNSHPTDNRILIGNKMARERMAILYDHSAREGALVIGTSNKSELLLGYGTIYGDMASAINPIGDLYKTQVYQLAEYVGVPESIMKRSPSADLWRGQTDEGEIGLSYSEIDSILFYLIDMRLSEDEIEQKGFSKEKILYVKKLVVSSQFKRKMPVIPKLSWRTVGHDFLYPRDWER